MKINLKWVFLQAERERERERERDRETERGRRERDRGERDRERKRETAFKLVSIKQRSCRFELISFISLFFNHTRLHCDKLEKIFKMCNNNIF